MNLRYFITFTIIIFFQFRGVSQSNELTLGFDYGLFYWSDITGFIKKIEYDRKLKRKFLIGVSYETSTAQSTNFYIYAPHNPLAISTNDTEWPFEWCKGCDKFGTGIKQLPIREYKLHNETLDLNVSYVLFLKNKHRMLISLGPTVTIFDLSQISLRADGRFESIFTEGQMPIMLILFQFERFVDAGLNFKIAYDYSISKAVSCGIKIGGHQFFNESNYYSTGIFSKIKF